jgi:hypothetical protein
MPDTVHVPSVMLWFFHNGFCYLGSELLFLGRSLCAGKLSLFKIAVASATHWHAFPPKIASNPIKRERGKSQYPNESSFTKYKQQLYDKRKKLRQCDLRKKVTAKQENWSRHPKRTVVGYVKNEQKHDRAKQNGQDVREDEKSQ